MEQVFGTLQNRQLQELRVAGIKTVPAANRFLKDRFVPNYNAHFAVPAAEPGSAFVPYIGRPREDVLCVQEDCVVGADNCVFWHRRIRVRSQTEIGINSLRAHLAGGKAHAVRDHCCDRQVRIQIWPQIERQPDSVSMTRHATRGP
jgi:hypothetical protein